MKPRDAARFRPNSHMFEVPVASAPDVFAKVARRFDLAIMGQPEPDTPALERLLVEAALFDSGRPVLIVPYIQRKGLTLDRVIVAWDGSWSAARAVADAMPLLVRAKARDVTPVAELLIEGGVPVIFYSGLDLPAALRERYPSAPAYKKPTPSLRLLNELANVDQRLAAALAGQLLQMLNASSTTAPIPTTRMTSATGS